MSTTRATPVTLTATLSQVDGGWISSLELACGTNDDIILGGKIVLNATGPAAGAYVNFYLAAAWDSAQTVNEYGGTKNDGLDGAGGPVTEGTDFHQEDIKRVARVTAETASAVLGWGPVSVLGTFSAMPDSVILLCENQSGGSLSAGWVTTWTGIALT